MKFKKYALKFKKDGMYLKGEKETYLCVSIYTLSKDGIYLDDSDLKSFSKNSIDLLSQVLPFRDKVEAKNEIDDSVPIQHSDFEEYDGEYLYKYVSADSLKYINKGLFLVGNIGYYRTMENQSARDELEGVTFVDTRMNNRGAYSCIFPGNNYYIFCSTFQEDDQRSKYHVENFGDVLLKIKAKPFLDKMKQRLGALSYTLYKVKYSNAKLLKSTLKVDVNPEEFSKLESNVVKTYFQHLIDDCGKYCFFIKPSWFAQEQEVRAIFEMPYDVNQKSPKKIECRGLLKHIEILN